MSHDEWKNLDSVEHLMTRAVTEPGAEISLSAFTAEGKERQVERRPVRSAAEGMTWAISTFDKLFAEGAPRFRVKLFPVNGKPESASVRRKDGAAPDEPEPEEDDASSAGPWRAPPMIRDDGAISVLQAEQRRLEARARAADAELERLRTSLTESERRAEDLIARLSAAEGKVRAAGVADAEISRLRRQLAEQQEQLRDAASAIDRAEDLAARLSAAEAKLRGAASSEGELGRLRRQLAERDQQLQDAEQRAADAETSAATLNSRLKRAQGSSTELASLRQRLAAAEQARDQAEESLANAEAALRQAEDRASRARSDSGELRRVKAALAAAEGERDDLRARADSLDAELARLLARTAAAQREPRQGRAAFVEPTPPRGAHPEQVRQLQQQVEDLQRQVAGLESANQQLRRDLHDSNVAYNELGLQALRNISQAYGSDDDEDDA